MAATPTAQDAAITVVPANAARWEDLQAVLGTRGDPFRCQCQRYKMRPGEAWARFPVEERADRLRAQTRCGQPKSDTTSGLVAYLEGEPVGWCAVEPRSAYPRLRSKCRVPWDGRSEDKADASVWAVTCFRHSPGLPPPRGQPRARPRGRRLRPRAWRSCPRRLPGAHRAREGDHLGRAPRWQPQHFCRRRLRRSQQAHPEAGRDADRLLSQRALFTAPSKRLRGQITNSSACLLAAPLYDE
jgi:hypothetical protein